MSLRLLPGTTLSSAFPAPSSPPSLSSLESAFELQEYIALLLRFDAHGVELLTKLPTSSNGEEVDKSIWVYEQIRRLVMDMNHPLITGLQEQCTRSTCPEMKANEWTYVCSAHGATQQSQAMGQCCAIDYILHTMDHTTALLNSAKSFPSRMSVPQTSQRHFPAIARRLARVFAHAYFHHREVFEESEVEHSVYSRFNALVRTYDILEPEFLLIPALSADDRSSDFGHELTRTSTMVQFEALNLADAPPVPASTSTSTASTSSALPTYAHSQSGAEDSHPPSLANSIASASHEAANAVEEAAFTPSSTTLASSPDLASITLPAEVHPMFTPGAATSVLGPVLAQMQRFASPARHPNALVIYPDVPTPAGAQVAPATIPATPARGAEPELSPEGDDELEPVSEPQPEPEQEAGEVEDEIKQYLEEAARENPSGVGPEAEAETGENEVAALEEGERHAGHAQGDADADEAQEMDVVDMDMDDDMDGPLAGAGAVSAPALPVSGPEEADVPEPAEAEEKEVGLEQEVGEMEDEEDGPAAQGEEAVASEKQAVPEAEGTKEEDVSEKLKEAQEEIIAGGESGFETAAEEKEVGEEKEGGEEDGQ